MEYTLEQVATLLGKSRRQIRYMISTGRLPATRTGHRWRVRAEDLPRSAGAVDARTRRVTALRDAVDEVLPTSPHTRGTSVTRIRAFEIGRGLLGQLREALGAEHGAVAHLRASLDQLAIGCHRYHPDHKQSAYTAARDRASLAACALAVEPGDAAGLLSKLESELLPAIAGLVRRTERTR